MKSLLLSLPLLLMVGLGVPATEALASDGWCDSDPILVIRTPAGNLVPVYVNVGAQNLLFTPDTLIGATVISYTVAPEKNGKPGTNATVSVFVPTLIFQAFAIRNTISTGAFGTGVVYAYGTGTAGSILTLTFDLPYS